MRRRRRWPAAEDGSDGGWVDGALTPGGVVAPPGVLPGWDWAPEGYGLAPRLDRVPRRVRLWYGAPWVDRWAAAWMWHHGGWELVPPPGDGDGDGPRGPARDRAPPPPGPLAPARGRSRDRQPPVGRGRHP
jgi:hypothetical protein